MSVLLSDLMWHTGHFRESCHGGPGFHLPAWGLHLNARTSFLHRPLHGPPVPPPLQRPSPAFPETSWDLGTARPADGSQCGSRSQPPHLFCPRSPSGSLTRDRHHHQVPAGLCCLIRDRDFLDIFPSVRVCGCPASPLNQDLMSIRPWRALFPCPGKN